MVLLSNKPCCIINENGMRKKLVALFLFISLLLNLLTTSSLVYAESVEIFSTLDSPPYVVNIQAEDRRALAPLIELGFDLFEASTYDSVGALVSESEYQYLLDQGFQVQKIPGFKIAAFPAATAITTCENGIPNGKFQGEIIPTTPTGLG